MIIVNVYGPHNYIKKKEMWNSLEKLLEFDNDNWVLCGDFNEVRNEDERCNCIFNARRATIFNTFMNNSKLIEVPLEGKRFTRIWDNGRRFSKLDRFLVSEHFLLRWGDLYVSALNRKDTDHCPLVLRNKWIDFGPKRTRVFDVWLDHKEADKIISKTWDKSVEGNRADLIFCRKLKATRFALPSKSTFGKIDSESEEYRKEAAIWESRAESSDLEESDRSKWMDVMGKRLKKEAEKRNMMKQKARVKWATDGEENSKFFHAYIRRRTCKNNIHGLNINGKWEEDPGETSHGCNTSFVSLIPKKQDSVELGDYRPISLIGGYYKIIAKLLSNRLRKVVPNLVGDEQTAFLRGKSILDGVLILNEAVDESKRCKAKTFLFKVDFSKAFDSLKWKFLFDIMRLMGFGSRWIKWIFSCLRYASISVLVNGSPTKEFKLEKGVRQGDPLSPFLFILASEGLNMIIKNASNDGLFEGVDIGKDKVRLTHLQYADDTIFIGEWRRRNIHNVMLILKSFEELSGLELMPLNAVYSGWASHP
ncbi:uncharacterized protein [Rutidosis leptorrhynchoides]|uniref:uncharacterized protein n=1 Tax=Rutidosis leptorrhynchoides TaxID=125765 RepID=UPI003A9A524B